MEASHPFIESDLAAMRALLNENRQVPPGAPTHLKDHANHCFHQMARFAHLAATGKKFQGTQFGLNLGRVQELLGSYGGVVAWWRTFEPYIVNEDWTGIKEKVKLYLAILELTPLPTEFDRIASLYDPRVWHTIVGCVLKKLGPTQAAVARQVCHQWYRALTARPDVAPPKLRLEELLGTTIARKEKHFIEKPLLMWAINNHCPSRMMYNYAVRRRNLVILRWLTEQGIPCGNLTYTSPLGVTIEEMMAKYKLEKINCPTNEGMNLSHIEEYRAFVEKTGWAGHDDLKFGDKISLFWQDSGHPGPIEVYVRRFELRSPITRWEINQNGMRPLFLIEKERSKIRTSCCY
jgi:hypothetical protein